MTLSSTTTTMMATNDIHNNNNNNDMTTMDGQQQQHKDCDIQMTNGDSIDSLASRLSAKLLMDDSICLVSYESELQMPDIMGLIQKDLSEPYSIYTYRYFIHNWPQLCFLAMDDSKCVGAIVCKLDMHKKMVGRGYIAMLAVDENYRKRRIGSNLVLKAIQAMIAGDADEVVLETEVTNKSALKLYENLGFVRDKRLFRYYLNGVDALRLKLWLK
ncbi:N-alpha-acetyltransferase 30-like [Oppia nitens]|uniref:N-alpha-acetyltransferase 30-like n=1 Tax=Oppia nitens TaxID=1686743 RepID=UPI0023DCB6EB|nr:N-alpha-acetyltransferase 30-like [Oppia nitens]